MKAIKYVSVFFCIASLAGCAELSTLNQKVGEFAGQINQTLGGLDSPTQVGSVINDQAISTHNIDSLYVRIKREFNFKTEDEYLKGLSGAGREMMKTQMHKDGIMIEATPGTYYHLSNAYEGGDFNVTLEKDGRKVLVSWKIKTKDMDFAQDLKQRLLKIVK